MDTDVSGSIRTPRSACQACGTAGEEADVLPASRLPSDLSSVARRAEEEALAEEGPSVLGGLARLSSMLRN